MQLENSQPVILTTDTVIFTLIEDSDNKKGYEDLGILMQIRPKVPFYGKLALPGGYLHTNEDDTALDCVYRVLSQKAFIFNRPYVEQYKCISGKNRDPRGWAMSDVYMTVVSPSIIGDAISKSAGTLRLVSLKELMAMSDDDVAFDHKEIIIGAADRLKTTSMYSILPAYFYEDLFTLPDLQRVYECLCENLRDKGRFRRFIAELDAFEETDIKQTNVAHKPACFWRIKPSIKSQYINVKKNRGL